MLLLFVNEMRWCASTCLCRFVHRHVAALSVALLFILCANQFFHFSGYAKNGSKGSPVCYQIVSPFAGSPALQQQQGQPNLHHLYHEQLHRQLFRRRVQPPRQDNQNGNNNSLFNGTFPTFYNYIPPEIPWAHARLDNRRMVRMRSLKFYSFYDFPMEC